MKRKMNSLNIKIKFIGFITLIICFNLIVFFNINISTTNNVQSINNEEITPHISDIYEFSYYKNIVIDHNQVSGTVNLVNFPILISILDSDLRAHSQSDGSGIAFYMGSTQLDHEIELYNHYYDGSRAQLIAWVRIPSLSWSTDTTIRIHYGYSGSSYLENPSGVWNNNYKGIWHLSEYPTGTIYDSTSHNYDGSSEGTMTTSDQVNGQIDGSIDFDGSNDYLNFGGYSDSSSDDAITVSFWMKANGLRNMNPVDKFPQYDFWNRHEGWSVMLLSSGQLRFSIGDDNSYSYVSTSSAYTAGVWVHVTCSYDGSIARVYTNGNQRNSASFSRDLWNNDDVPLRFGRPKDAYTGNVFWGILDEVQISNIARPANWIATEHNNQYNPSNFYTVGVENGVAAPQIGVNVGDKYIYEVVEKNEDFKAFLPEMHAIVNATAWMYLINETINQPTIYSWINPLYDITIIFVQWYFDINEDSGYTVSGELEKAGYPPVKGVSEWYSGKTGKDRDLNYGHVIGSGENAYWQSNLVDGNPDPEYNLPGLVADNEMGEGVLDFLALYDQAVIEEAQGNTTLRTRMVDGYALRTTTDIPSDVRDPWYRITWLVRYYREYFVPVAVPLVWPLVIQHIPQVEYLNVLEDIFGGAEVKGEYTCYEIKTINPITGGWNVGIDKWDYTDNMEDFNTTAADYSQNIKVYVDAADLGGNITVANMSLRTQDVIPVIADIYLSNIMWWEDVRRDGNTIAETFYSGPIDPFPFDPINLTLCMTYDNNGMIQSTSLYADVVVTSHFTQRAIFYELSIYQEPIIVQPGDDPTDNGVIPIDSRIIILSSISIIFALGFLLVIKKSKGYRR